MYWDIARARTENPILIPSAGRLFMVYWVSKRFTLARSIPSRRSQHLGSDLRSPLAPPGNFHFESSVPIPTTRWSAPSANTVIHY